MRNPIGIFDSGVGGLSIWKEIVTLLPHEDTLYLADSKNAPYGQYSKEKITALCIKNTEYLIKKGCKIIVVACNTATTNAIATLREMYDMPFIGIEPAIKPASLKTKTKKIGILATKGTLNSELFAKTVNKIKDNITIIEQTGEGLVPLIESGKMNSIALDLLLTKYLCNLVKKDIDYLVLGCSHYPFLIPQIKRFIGNDITIIDSGEAVARQTKAVLTKLQLTNTETSTGTHQLYSNKDVKVMRQLVKKSDSITIKTLDF